MNVHVLSMAGNLCFITPAKPAYLCKMFLSEICWRKKYVRFSTAFATPTVSSLLIFPNANSILITDSLVNLQRMEKIVQKTDFSKKMNPSCILQWYTPNRFSAEVLKNEFESKYEAFF